MASGSKKVIYAALIGNSLISITKFAAAFVTGSSAMLSEGIHSMVDTGNQGLLLHGIARSKKPADEAFPFGHGKEIYFWSFIVAILIFALGGGISIYEGIKHLQHPEPIANPLINYIVLGLAMVFEGAAWLFAFREFSRAKGKWGYLEAVQRAKDPSIFVVLFEDTAAMLGLIVAFAGVALTQITGSYLFDGTASIIIGLILVGTAVWLAYETKGLLIGESANKAVVQGIRKMANDIDVVEYVNEVLTMHMGPDFVLVNMSVDFRDSVSADEVERAIGGMDGMIKQHFPQVKRIFIEAEKRFSSNS
ncbi:cation diffusion facilitator family transporter [Candidatus Thiodiazotropha sp. LNASS1]|uniref:cation diffusion facilitator family transporter n=1 Tax=Candidatus Thiodiazotropha sp. LNASS1 TaxID=3096260 RepID=UPI000D387DE5|nr:cation diffusion facilitator family transporter [Candidatus Thiodiazotropha sp. (ex. Lucinisca nassula)]PUB82462.1 MAG: cation transporter [gamma proteobacterium symbiont of Ctena orbiculata]PUB83719.1 MAG: cation transporter [gamma proteobacterium symbiont of Ctena orbiculata]